MYERKEQQSTVINTQQRKICGSTLGKKTNRGLQRTGLDSKPRNFLLLIDTQHIQGFIGIVYKLSESKTYSICHPFFFFLKKPLKSLNCS